MVNVMSSGTHAWRIIDYRELLSKVQIKAFLERISNKKKYAAVRRVIEILQKLYLLLTII